MNSTTLAPFIRRVSKVREKVVYFAHTHQTVTVWNFDQTGLRVLPSCKAGIVQPRCREEVTFVYVDKRMVTLLVATPMKSSGTGRLQGHCQQRRLPLQTCRARSLKKATGRPLETMVEIFQWLDRRVQAVNGDGGRLHHWIAVLDCASVHKSEAFLTVMRRDLWHIHLCFVPATFTATCQPLDISFQVHLGVRLARCVAEHVAGEVVAAMDDGRPAKLDSPLTQLKEPLIRCPAWRTCTGRRGHTSQSTRRTCWRCSGEAQEGRSIRQTRMLFVEQIPHPPGPSGTCGALQEPTRSSSPSSILHLGAPACEEQEGLFQERKPKERKKIRVCVLKRRVSQYQLFVDIHLRVGRSSTNGGDAEASACGYPVNKVDARVHNERETLVHLLTCSRDFEP